MIFLPCCNNVLCILICVFYNFNLLCFNSYLLHNVCFILFFFWFFFNINIYICFMCVQNLFALPTQLLLLYWSLQNGFLLLPMSSLIVWKLNTKKLCLLILFNSTIHYFTGLLLCLSIKNGIFSNKNIMYVAMNVNITVIIACYFHLLYNVLLSHNQSFAGEKVISVYGNCICLHVWWMISLLFCATKTFLLWKTIVWLKCVAGSDGTINLFIK